MTPFEQTVHHFLSHLYGPRASEVQRRLGQHIDHFRSASQAPAITENTAAEGDNAPTWSEKDQWVISYGDSIVAEETPPLAVLNEFLQRYLGERISGVHVLPFFPWSSDDGFSVIHYREVNPELGDWQHIRELASHYDVMGDLVLNHVSRESLWFVDYLTGSLPGRDYFIEIDPETDVSDVVRPRSSPLLVPISTRRGTLIITETNVPHAENISYFGLERLANEAPDEAHMVYQFALPPLLLHTLTRGEATTLQTWLSSLPILPRHCTYLNFTASHDGIGVRPLEGVLPDHERDALLELMHRFGGFVSMRSNPDGSDSPYEINITWFEAMRGTRRGPDPWQIARFLCSQAIMLTLQGIPALYIHTLTGTLNDVEGVERSGRLRSINRRRWQRDELALLLESPSTPTHDVFHALSRLLELRRTEPCFHPNATQRVLTTPPDVLAIERGPLSDGRRLLALFNVTDTLLPLDNVGEALEQALSQHAWRALDLQNALEETALPPYAIRWMVTDT